MNNKVGRPLLLSIALILLLAACTDSATPQVVNEPAGEVVATPMPTVTLEATVTAKPTIVFEPTTGVLPAVQTMEAILAPSEFVLGELSTYQVEPSGLSFDYPAGWIVTEDPGAGIRIESKEGIGDHIATANGALVVIIPLAAGDLPGETPVEKLASFIISNGTSPTAALGEPLTATINGQELAFTSFVDQDAGQEGVIAAFLAGDKLAVILAVAGGESRVSYRPGVETIVNSFVLAQGE
jgi:hypothetical protein